MKVLVGCEFSQIVTKAFRARGHEAYSCDLIPTEGNPEWHFQEDVLKVIERETWDLGIFHPPCTYLSYAATRVWNEPGRIKKRFNALEFFRQLWESPIEKICIENPKGCASPVIAKYSQIIQPWYWGEPYYKTTCLWLKNLPLLQHTESNTLFEKKTHADNPETTKVAGNWYNKGGSTRQKMRAVTFQSFADTMAEQWGSEELNK